IAAGIRRIEAITYDAAKEYFTVQSEAYNNVKAVLKNVNDPVKAITSLQEENTHLKKQIEALLKDKAKNLKGELKSEFQEINGINF
ncbi:hypothetical protein J9332_42710, partial [Aquimarina celericrescens]|nr:hypothetical protein [Aquimarina celericrescens]